MPLYPFVDRDGNTFELHAEFSEAETAIPPFDGKWYRLRGGLVCKRLAPQTAAVKAPKERHFVSKTFPPWYKYHRMAGGEFDAKTGEPRFDSWGQIERTVALANEHGEGLVYDGEREIGNPEKTVDEGGGVVPLDELG